MADPKEGYNSGVNRNVSGEVNSSGVWAESAVSAAGFKPSQYDPDLTMDDTAQSVALSTGVKLGKGRVSFTNRGASTEAIRIAFGTSAANAEANLTIDTGAATTGYFLPATVSTTDQAGNTEILGVPALATYYAVANAVASDTQPVSIVQGI